jgi:hypothetical protein
MPKVKLSEYSQTAANNTDINSINLAEGMLPSDVNNAIRELMKQLKDFQMGAQGDGATFSSLVLTTTPLATASGGTGTTTATGSGSNVLSNGPTFSGAVTFGGNAVISSAGVINDTYGKLRAIPSVGDAKTSGYTLQTADVGRVVEIGSGGGITIPNSTFSLGDAVSLFNNTSGSVTVTCSVTTCYIAGTNTDKDTVSLATRGVATVLFLSGTTAVISGNVS